jgi:hypothetical protein
MPYPIAGTPLPGGHLVAWLAIVTAAFVVVAGPGCGSRTMASVSGTVTQRGRPVAGAFVMFSPAAGPAAGAVTDADGRYRLLTGGPHGGRVFTGRCVVTVSDANPEGRGGGPSILPRLANAAESGLVAELVPGANVVDLELPER